MRQNLNFFLNYGRDRFWQVIGVKVGVAAWVNILALRLSLRNLYAY